MSTAEQARMTRAPLTAEEKQEASEKLVIRDEEDWVAPAVSPEPGQFL